MDGINSESESVSFDSSYHERLKSEGSGIIFVNSFGEPERGSDDSLDESDSIDPSDDEDRDRDAARGLTLEERLCGGI